jgi:hypothetical protein
MSRTEWLRGLKSESAAAPLLGLLVRMPPGHVCLSVCCECCVLKGASVRRADHSSRGVPPSVACLSVIVKAR